MRNEKFLFAKILVLAMTFVFSGCQRSGAQSIALPAPPTPSISPALAPTPTANSDSSIRKIDFKNFTYHSIGNRGVGDIFTLKNGQKEQTATEDGATLSKIEFGDVTNDNREEALISILPVMDGNCQCEMVFVYTLANGQPKLLWSFDTWDKAEGGLKRVYAENGRLTVETFGDNKFENDKWEFSFPQKGAGGYCCPTAYTKIRFGWNGEKFIAEGLPEVFDYDQKDQKKEDN